MKITLKGLLIPCFLILLSVPGFLFGDARPGTDQSRPRYASDRIKIKLGAEAIQRTALPTGLYAEARSFGINELDQIYSRNGGQRIIRAHIRARDAAWEARTGFDRWFVIRLDGRSSVEEAIKSFKSNRYIEDAIPEYYAYTTAVPNDTYYPNNWGHNNTAQLPVYSGSSHSGAGVGTIGFDSDAQLAWDQSQGYGSASVIIAIIDSGVDTAHPDLRLVAGYDYGDNDSNPMDNSAEPGHGTACAGIAAAKANNNLGVTGVAGGCSVMPLKVADSNGDMSFTSIENALMHAGNNNVDVVSMSFGAEGGTAEGSSPSTDTALEYAYSHGVTLLAATANSNASTMAYPSNHNKVISVGAASPTGQRKSPTSSDGENWWGSNYGVNTQNDKNSVDIMAPTILPATDITGAGNGYDVNSDYSMWFNGTSCATPYAAGVAALLISKDSTLTPAQVRTALTNTSTDMTIDGGAGWDRYTGYGLVNANTALFYISYAPPQNLSSTSGNGFVDLAWQAPVSGSPTSYKIYRNSSYLTTLPGLTYHDTAVANEQSYSYYVIAVYSGGESVPSNTVNATPTSAVYIEGIIGTGTTSNANNAACPINVYYQSLHGQSVYTVAELNAAGIYGPIGITQIGFNITELPTKAMPGYVIRMGHTSATNVSSWISTGLNTYWTSASYQPTATGWNMFTLSTPFAWNGSSNIVIDTAFGVIGSYAQTGTTLYTSQANGYRYIRSDSADQTSVFTNGDTSVYRPNIKLIYPQALPDPEPVTFVESFESGIGDWLTANQNNAWACGTASKKTGVNGVYISNDSGTSNAYTYNSASVSHLYRDISFPAGSDNFVLRFNWKGNGQTTIDCFKVYLVDTSTTPLAGTALSTGQIGVAYHSQTTWQETTINLATGLNGLTKRLVFTWVNNASSGSNPPAALDDIRIVPGSQSDAAVVIGNTVSISPPAVIDPDSNVINSSLVITNLSGTPSFVVVTSGYNSQEAPYNNAGLDFLLSGAVFGGITINFTHNLGFVPYQLAYMLGDSGNWNVVDKDPAWTATTASWIVPVSKAETDVRIAFSNSSDGTLPVELSSFNAILIMGNQVRLNWVTATETGLLGYNIYRHTQESLESAELISELISGTNTSTEQHYIFNDNETNSDTSYYYWLQGLDLDGWSAFYGPVNIKTSDHTDTNPPMVPAITELRGNYPNPFNPSTTLSYSLLSPAKVKIDIYNCRGQLVRGFSQEHASAGFYSLVFDGKDSSGNTLASGVYIYRMRSGDYDSTRRMLLSK